MVVFTQGKDATLVACGGVVSSHEVHPRCTRDAPEVHPRCTVSAQVPVLEADKLVDTNGAGDAFVGGFLALLAKGGDLVECVDAGHWAARQIIQVSGCKIPEGACSYVR